MEFQNIDIQSPFHKVPDMQGCWPVVRGWGGDGVQAAGLTDEGKSESETTDSGASQGWRECAGHRMRWAACIWGLVRFIHGGTCGFRSTHDHHCAVFHHTSVRQLTCSVWWALEISSLLLLLLLWTVFYVSFCEHPASFLLSLYLRVEFVSEGVHNVWITVR